MLAAMRAAPGTPLGDFISLRVCSLFYFFPLLCLLAARFSGVRSLAVAGGAPTTLSASDRAQNKLDTKLRSGTAGRASVNGLTVTVFGNSGFLGRYVVNRFGRVGSQVIVPFRGDEYDTRHLKVMGDAGRIVSAFFSTRDPERISRLVEQSDVVINMIGRDYETANFSYEEVHIDAAETIAKASKAAGVTRYLHVSALGAATDSPSRFLATKALGEQATMAAFPEATIIRPARMYGHEDRLLHRIACTHFIFGSLGAFLVDLAVVGVFSYHFSSFLCHFFLLFPILPTFLSNPPLDLHSSVLIPGDMTINEGRQVLLPVYVGDVALGIFNAATNVSTAGQALEFVGPRAYTYSDLLQLYSTTTRQVLTEIDYPADVLKAITKAMKFIPPSPPLCPDDIVRMEIDEVVTPGAAGLEAVGVHPTQLSDVAIAFLRHYRSSIYYDQPAETSGKAAAEHE